MSNKDKALAIRERYALGDISQSELAKEFDMSNSMVGQIVRGQIHKDVGGSLTFAGESQKQRIGYLQQLEFTESQWNDLIGNMLGDGCIGRKRGTKNCRFTLGQKLDSKEYVLAMFDRYKPFISKYTEAKTKRPARIDGKISHAAEHWDGTYLFKCGFQTSQLPFFTQQRKRWYESLTEKNSPKIVPRDIVLNWHIVAIWVTDDGSNEQECRRLKINTQDFSLTEVKFLQQRLKDDLGITANINYNRGKPILVVMPVSYVDFIHNITPYIPWQCMAHKIDLTKYTAPISLLDRENWKPNTSGCVGVYYSERQDRWIANISSKHLGTFKLKEDAINARKEALAKRLAS